MKTPSPCRPARRMPLAACLALALCCPAPLWAGADHLSPGRSFVRVLQAHPGVRPGAARARVARERPNVARSPMALPVTSCADDGSPGTLRAVVASAASGDTVDMSQLTCGTITLVTGQINVYVDNLAVQGPGRNALTIDGNHAGRVIAAYGHGTLAIADLSIANGYMTAPAYGGCLYSYASALSNRTMLSRVTVDGCTSAAASGSTFAVGGGILTFGFLSLDASTISNNTATGEDGTQIRGGGAYAYFGLDVSDSTVTGNSATRSSPGTSGFVLGGGLESAPADRRSSISGSTLSNNVADDFGGGLFLYVPHASGATPTMYIANSTVSGNTSGAASGIEIDTSTNAPFRLVLENSTVAFNTFTTDGRCGGLAQGGYTDSVVDLESSILANNTGPGGVEYDACTSYDTNSLVGANNLIIVSELPVPPGTISADPMLGPLQDNGGPTLTHALLPGSPAIDVGNNVAALDFDQRGTGFVRSFGAGPDIGAFEAQPDNDTIFVNGFDP